MDKLLIKIPTRQRAHKLKDVLDIYCENISLPETKILLSLDNDDIESIDTARAYESDRLIIEVGYSENKIHAINRDIYKYIDEFDVLLIGSDDMIPQARGFDEIIIADMQKYYPEGNGVLWYNDGFRGAYSQYPLNTMPVLGKEYYKSFGYVYHPSYKSLWCDNEFMVVANKLGKQTYVDKVLIKHELWANIEGVEKDELYERNEAFFNEDMLNFNRRKRNRFKN